MDLGGPGTQVKLCKISLYFFPKIRTQHLARVAQWIRRWSTKPKIPGSIPGAGFDVLNDGGVRLTDHHFGVGLPQDLLGF